MKTPGAAMHWVQQGAFKLKFVDGRNNKTADVRVCRNSDVVLYAAMSLVTGDIMNINKLFVVVTVVRVVELSFPVEL